MTICPQCQVSTHVLQTPSRSQRQGIQFDHCQHCKLIFLDFGAQRPALYQKLEEQVERWEAGIAKRNTPA